MGVSNVDFFSYTVPRRDRLESLANNALSNAITLYTNKNYEGAIKEFKRAIGLAPSSSHASDAANYMAQAYLQLDDTHGAIEAYKKSIQLNPYRDDTHISLGNLYFFQQQFQDAQNEYEQAVKLNPSADNRFSLGQAYMNTGRYSDAESQFRQVQTMEPNKPNGYYGLGQTYARQSRYEDAVSAFQNAIALQQDFYDAYAEMGYAYADSGKMEEANEILNLLQEKDPSLASTFSNYLYQVEPPQLTYAYAYGTFPYSLSSGTQVAALDAYLANANASKTFTMTFQFDKEMDRESVENPLNWTISRSKGSGPGELYNFGMAIPSTEVQLDPYPISIYYDSDKLTATIQFNIQQNASADGTIDPSHIVFSFSGKDKYGVAMDPQQDEFSGFSGIA